MFLLLFHMTAAACCSYPYVINMSIFLYFLRSFIDLYLFEGQITFFPFAFSFPLLWWK